MKNFLRHTLLFKVKALLILAFISGGLLFFTAGLLIFQAPQLAYPLLLHFDGAGRAPLLGEPFHLWLVWATGLVCAIINFFFGRVFFFRERMLTYLFFSANMVISLLTLVAIGTIISMN